MDETKDKGTGNSGVTPLSSLGPITPISEVQPKDDRRMMTSLLRSALYNMKVQDGDRFLRAQEAIVEKAVNMAMGGNVPMIEMIWAYSDGKPLAVVGDGSGNSLPAQINIYMPSVRETVIEVDSEDVV